MVLQACKPNYIEPRSIPTLYKSFEAKNESDRDAIIYLFKPDNKLLKYIILNPGDSAILNGGKSEGGHHFSLYDHLDSAKIEFADGKQLTQTFRQLKNRDTLNNVLNPQHYKNYLDRRRFTLTQKDYDRAK